MELYLDPKQRASMSVQDLARYIFCIVKEAKQEEDYGRNTGIFYWTNEDDFHLFYFRVQELRDWLCKRIVGRNIQKEEDLAFVVKYYEAIALLKHRGLLIPYLELDKLCFSSVGEKSDFHHGILILLDDAQEIVDSLKEEVPNLDPVVEQYYVESLRACQEALYISSVICLGAASEGAVHCLAGAIIKHNPKYEDKIRRHRRDISQLIKYLSQNIKNLSDSIIDGHFMNDLREELDAIAFIYRRNRNEAGHPRRIQDDVNRTEQENYLYSFRRYAKTIFKAIDMLNGIQQEG